MRTGFASLSLVLAAGIFQPVVSGSLDGANAEEPTRPPQNAHANPTKQIKAPGLDNVFRLTDNLVSGSSPEGDAGFESLHKLGIKTIISVDGARPDVARARKYGLRYVHLPIGYDGMSREQALRIVKAARDLPGPVYIHCHHGKHRGPAAAAVVRLCTDRTCTVETAIAEMRRAGTDPRYKGLYDAPRDLRKPSEAEMQRLDSNFPEIASVAGFAQVMVKVDSCWDHLKETRAAGWRRPNGSPDLDPAHEALQLVEQFREGARLSEVKQRSQEFRDRLTAAESRASELEQVLRTGQEKGTVDAQAAESAFRRVSASCTGCHAKYRDVPQKR